MSPILVSGRLYVDPGVTLRIDPGVVVKFSSSATAGKVNVSGIQVNGRLLAQGTAGLPIVFTSWFDDTAGGQTDGGGRAPVAGDWNGLRFNPTAEQAESVITHATVRYGSSAGGSSCLYEGAVQVGARGRLAMARSEIVDSYAASVSVADFVASGTAGSASFIQMRFANAPCAFRALGGTMAYSVIESSVAYGWSYATYGIPHGMEVVGNYIESPVRSYSWDMDGTGTTQVLFRGNYVAARGTARSTSTSLADLRYNYWVGRNDPGQCYTGQENPPMTYDSSTYDAACWPGTRFRTKGYADLVAPWLAAPPQRPPVGPLAPRWIPTTGIPGGQAWGCGCAFANFTANPINTSVGAKFERAVDLSVAAPGVPVEWGRSYNGADPVDGPLGVGWTHDFNASLSENAGVVTFREPTGGLLEYTHQPDGSYLGNPGVRGTLTNTGAGWKLRSPKGLVWTFDTAGRLTKVADDGGRGVTLAYDGSGRLSTLTDQAGHETTLG